MADVDVQTEIVIERDRDAVARIVLDPDAAPRWYANIESVEWRTPRPLSVGSRLAFVARFLGRRLSYTYEVIELVPGHRMVMRTSEGPFPMETRYALDALEPGRTRMCLRNLGRPNGFGRVLAPLVARAMRRENVKDLERLKSLLERS